MRGAQRLLLALMPKRGRPKLTARAVATATVGVAAAVALTGPCVRTAALPTSLARVPPHHLIFSIWALTQHYADFDVQVRSVLGDGHDPFAEAGEFLQTLFDRLLRAP